MRALVFVLILALPGLGWAQQWDRLADGATVTQPVSELKKSQRAFYETASTTQSLPIDISQCLYVSIQWNPDEDGTTTGATGYVYTCDEEKIPTVTAANYLANNCTKRLADTDGDGVDNDLPLDGTTVHRKGLQFIQGSWLLVGTITNASSDQIRVTATCH